MQRMVVRPETALVRPFVVCAILRGVTLDKHRYASFIDLQVPPPPRGACLYRSRGLLVPIEESYISSFAESWIQCPCKGVCEEGF